MATFGFGQTKTDATAKTSGTVKSDPWAPSVPYLQDFLAKVGATKTASTPGQNAALDMMARNAHMGNEHAPAISDAAGTMLATPDRTGVVGDAYSTFKNQMGGYADGSHLDVANNPQIQNMMKVVGDDQSNMIRQLFSGGGRMFSDTHANAEARGVTSATAPIMLDQYNRERAAQAQAAGDLFTGGVTTGTAQGSLDASRAGVMAQGADMAQKGVEARDYGAGRLLDIATLKTQAPLDRMTQIANLLYPAAGLGGTQKQDSTTKTKAKETKLGGSLSLL